MRLQSFLGLVEIRTKIASVIPFALGTFYTVYHFGHFKWVNFGILFLSMIAFDMVTTALNNYFDYKRAVKKHGYNYESHNAIVRDQLKEWKVIATIVILLSIAILLGLLLVTRTNITLLAVGVLSFAVGVCYSFGPVPISRTPLGELLSGFFMGFVIVFLSVYIHIYDRDIAAVLFESNLFFIRLDMPEVLSIFLVSIPAICGIANIMLANNICDIQDDLENRRYTLPIYIGRKYALLLFRCLYYLAYIAIVASVLLRLTPWISLLSLLTWVPVQKHLMLFDKKQSKKDTFPLAVKNFIMIGMSYVFLLAAGTLLDYWM